MLAIPIALMGSLIYLLATGNTLNIISMSALSIAIGMVVDLFLHVPGVHMAACVAVSYLRPLVVSGFVQDIERMKGAIGISSLGADNYIRLLAILVAVHHTAVFLLEAFTFQHFGYTVLQIVLSGVISFALVLMLEYVRKNT